MDGVAMAHYELHAWCLLVLAWVFVPFYARSLVFTMPEFLERRFSPASRYMLSVVSLITFVVSKIAVGIFAGGRGIRTLLPDVILKLGGMPIDSFWIGSVLVILLTGLYTMLGGMRAVAYNDAVQTVVLIIGSTTLTIYGLLRTWRLAGAAASVRLGHVQSLEAADSRRRGGHLGAGARKERGRGRRHGTSTQFPWLGMAICARSSACGIGVPISTSCNGPWAPRTSRLARRGSIFAAFLKLFPVYLFIIPGLIWFALAKSHKLPGLEGMVTPDGNWCRARRRRLPADGQIHAAGRPAGHCRRRIALGPDGLAGRRVQRLLDAVYRRSLREVEARATQHQLVRIGRMATALMVLDRPGLDSGYPRGARAVRLSAVGPRLPGAADFRRLLFRRRLQAAQCQGLLLAAMVVGFVLGIFRMLVDTPVTMKLAGFEHGYAPGTFLWIVNNIYFQYFSVLICLVCIA